MPVESLLCVWTLLHFLAFLTTKDIILNQWKVSITKLHIIIHSFQEKFYLFLII